MLRLTPPNAPRSSDRSLPSKAVADNNASKGKLSLKSIATLVLAVGAYFVAQQFGLIQSDGTGDSGGGTAVAEPEEKSGTTQKPQESKSKSKSKPKSEQASKPPAPKEPASKPVEKEQTKKGDGTALVRQSFRAMRSDVMVEFDAKIKVILRDDNEGSRHQKFLLDLGDDLTVLVAHNIDLAPRVPVDRGDMVRIKGEYEYNEKGGVVHWTHHDPKGWHEDGWIEHDGKVYK
ncbi:MAG: DUF3465 domain-containing protein [bacterium]|nr:DUF3465 domain-containing protein [bacterium]